MPSKNSPNQLLQRTACLTRAKNVDLKKNENLPDLETYGFYASIENDKFSLKTT